MDNSSRTFSSFNPSGTFYTPLHSIEKEKLLEESSLSRFLYKPNIVLISISENRLAFFKSYFVVFETLHISLMAAMLVSRKAFSPSLFQKLISPVRSVAAQSTLRSFNTNAQRHDLDDDHGMDIDRRTERSSVSRGRRSSVSAPTLFPDVLDPFYPSRSLSQVLNLMDQMMENPFAAMSRGMGGGSRRGFDVREDNDALYLRIDMPGLGKEDVKVSAEQNTLLIKGEGEKESEDEESGRKYSSRIDLPPEIYKVEGIRAEMKNGVLRVSVPKVKEEERKSVFQVKVD